MTIQQLTKQLIHKSKYIGINYQLDSLKPLLKKCNNPHKNLATTIHIAGTNGKGSTLQFLNQLCQDRGLRVGIFTSPHLECYTERIQINNIPISKTDFQHYFHKIHTISNGDCSEFECLTLMSLCYFVDKKPDIIIYETGLGGRLDATNIITPTACIITSIDYDHEQFLGNTIEQITREKAGIIKPHIPLITTTENTPTIKKILRQTCLKNKAPYTECSPLITLPKHTQLTGNHQLINASLAIAAFKQLYPNADQKNILTSIKNARHWGRYMSLKTNSQTIIIDAAHNKQSMTQLMNNLNQDYPNQQKTFLIGLNKTKNTAQLIKIIEKHASSIYFCEFDSQFSEKITSIQKETSHPLKQFHLTTPIPNSPLLIITGSIYFLGAIKNDITKSLNQKNNTTQ